MRLSIDLVFPLVPSAPSLCSCSVCVVAGAWAWSPFLLLLLAPGSARHAHLSAISSSPVPVCSPARQLTVPYIYPGSPTTLCQIVVSSTVVITPSQLTRISLMICYLCVSNLSLLCPWNITCQPVSCLSLCLLTSNFLASTLPLPATLSLIPHSGKPCLYLHSSLLPPHFHSMPSAPHPDPPLQ